MGELTDVDLDAIVACLPDCVEVYGPYRPRHAPECRHDDITVLVDEVRRLRDEAVTLRRAWCIEGDGLREHLARVDAERDRLRDGIRELLGRQQAVVAEARDDDPEDPAVWARHFAASVTATSLRCLLDDQECEAHYEA